ncbi:hypothetical protein GIB67_015950 [Kingdonia uniflora]|uniref:F-box protein n=1 Tax=Kingdonia uniflora TaxID=39325 RepID=A0A7J7PCA1_9MAGN|nr:hypothetical protein GIB67_015950 [Kingdonia uniflora]
MSVCPSFGDRKGEDDADDMDIIEEDIGDFIDDGLSDGCLYCVEMMKEVFSSDDIAIEILSRLPIEFFAGLKCVYANSGALANGVYYWWTTGPSILSFDLENEKCQVMKLPGNVTEASFNMQKSKMCLGESEGYLHYLFLSMVSLVIWKYSEPMWTYKYFIPLWEMDCNSIFLKSWCIKPHNVSDWFTTPSRTMNPFAFQGDIVFMEFSRGEKLSIVVLKIKELFKDQKEFIWGLVPFMPNDYEISLQLDNKLPLKELKMKDASNILPKIKEPIQNDSFHKLSVGIMHQKGNNSKSEICQVVVP